MSSTAASSPVAGRSTTAMGIGMLCTASFMFSIQDVIIKLVAGSYPLTEVLAIRSTIALPLFLAAVCWTSGLGSLWSPQIGWVALRALSLFCAYLTYYLAIAALPLADATALYFVAPLIIVAMAGHFLGEPVGWVRWAAVGLGFVGVIIALNPGAGVFDWAALLTLISAVSYAAAQIMARALRGTETAAVLSFHQNITFLMGALALAALTTVVAPAAVPGQHEHASYAFLTRPWIWPTARDFLLMAACGPIAAIASTMLADAYRKAPANLVTVFEYTSLIWLSLWGYVFWSEVPKLTTLAGAALIISAGIIAVSARSGRRRG